MIVSPAHPACMKGFSRPILSHKGIFILPDGRENIGVMTIKRAEPQLSIHTISFQVAVIAIGIEEGALDVIALLSENANRDSGIFFMNKLHCIGPREIRDWLIGHLFKPVILTAGCPKEQAIIRFKILDIIAGKGFSIHLCPQLGIENVKDDAHGVPDQVYFVQKKLLSSVFQADVVLRSNLNNFKIERKLLPLHFNYPPPDAGFEFRLLGGAGAKHEPKGQYEQ